MAESIEQFDLFEDRQAQLARLLRESVARIGLSRVADILGKEPSTISHQLSGLDPGKTPSAKLEAVCWDLDPEFRRMKAAVVGQVIALTPDLSVEDVLREVLVLAGAGEFGNAGRVRVMELYARMRKP